MSRWERGTGVFAREVSARARAVPVRDPNRKGPAQYAREGFSENGRVLTGARDLAESMRFDFQLGTLLLGIVIFLARVVDVSMGTMRTISIVQGRTKIAFVLGFLEVSIWLMVISAVVNDVMTKPLLGIFYASVLHGNVVGIKLERRLAFGHIIFRVISTCNGRKIADKVRDSGYAVTTFEGEGKCGAVTMLYVVCRRRDLNEIIPS